MTGFSRIIVSGINNTLSPTPFRDAAGLNPCRCPGCDGEVRRDALPFAVGAKAYEPDCRVCGGGGINRHLEAA